MTEHATSGKVLEAVGLEKTYRSGQRDIPVLGDASLCVGRGSTLSISGESGSGKSTLLNLLSGIEEADKGEVRWNDCPLAGIPESLRPARRARFLGFVFQSYYLIPELDARDNVALPGRIAGLAPREARARAEDLLEEVGLRERLRSQPDQLSGGERQRAGIARALMNRPEVLLADEPTGNLDERTAGRVMELLMATVLKHGTALVLVTHHQGFASMVEDRFTLESGRLVPL
ncbi:MAG: ABC transporter ATP-binding protein [Oceanipulchritudo sp.]